jgi:hypothetical protein
LAASCDHLISHAATGCLKLSLSEHAMRFFPFGDGEQPITDEKRTSSGACHPGRDTDPIVCCGKHDLLVNVGINRDCELR